MKGQISITEKYGVLLADVLSVILSFCFALFLRFGGFSEVEHPEACMSVGIWIVLFTVLYDTIWGGTKNFIHRGYFVEAQHCVGFGMSLSVFMGFGIFLLRMGQEFSRLVFGYTVILVMLLMYCSRMLLKKTVRRGELYGSSAKKIILVMPEGSDGKDLRHSLKITETITINTDEEGAKSLIETLRTMAVDEVIINLPDASGAFLQNLVMELSSMGLVCRVVFSMPGLDIRSAIAQNYEGLKVLSYGEASEKEGSRLVIKRIMDIMGGLAGILITAVMFPFIAIAIKLDSPGPVLFSQVRIGLNGRRFNIYKFRSMYMDAEERKKDLESQNEMKGLMFKMEDDPRITKVGRFLRKTSLDEFPQFFNVLRGEMSLVGTRPPTEDEFLNYTPYYRRRICMTPGLTGLWQVSGRSSVTDFDDVVRYDLDYIDNWSISLDIKIILNTVAVVFTGKGAG